MTNERRPHNSGDNEHQESAARIPQDLQAERSLIGAALLSPIALATMVKETRPEDFYHPLHAAIASIAVRALEQGWPFDSVTVNSELIRDERWKGHGPFTELITMIGETPSVGGATRYAQIVHDAATMRRLLASTVSITEEITDGGRGLPDAHDAVERAQRLMADVAANNGSRRFSNLVQADVARIVAGDITRIEPDFLTRTDGLRLFYAGKMHSLQAEPSTGKSWIALLASSEVLEMGGSVLYLDYEDTGEGIVGRLMGLGVDPDAAGERFVYIQPQGPFGASERLEIDGIIRSVNPDLVVIDGVAEALTRDGLSEDKANEVVQWIERVPRRFARSGAAVVMLDHVGKDRENRGRWARGSGAKLGAIDGAAYEVKVISAFSRHRAGSMRITIAKDRPGAVGELGSVAAVVHFEPAGDGVVVRMRLEPPPRDTNEKWEPTGVMERISHELERASLAGVELRASDVRGSIGVKTSLASKAIEELTTKGFIRIVQKGRMRVIRLIKPYREGDKEIPLEEPPLFPIDPADESTVIQGPWKPLVD